MAITDTFDGATNNALLENRTGWEKLYDGGSGSTPGRIDTTNDGGGSARNILADQYPYDGGHQTMFVTRDDSGGFDDDQYAELESDNDQPDIGVLVRADSSGDGYGARLGGGLVRSYRIDTGTLTTLASNFPSTAAGDTIRVDATGTTIDRIRNGTSDGTSTDSTHSAGAPGVWYNGAGVGNGGEMDNFECTDEASSGQPIVGATTATIGVTFPTGVLTPATAAIAGATTATFGVTFPAGVLTPATAPIAGATTATFGVTFPTGVLTPGTVALAGATTATFGVTFPLGVLASGAATQELAGATTATFGVTFPLGVLASEAATQELTGATTATFGVTYPTGVLAPGTAALVGATTATFGVTFSTGVIANSGSSIVGATTATFGVTFSTGVLTPGTGILTGATTATFGVTFPLGVFAGVVYIYTPPQESELREYRGPGQQYLLHERVRPSISKGVTVLLNGATYSTSVYPTADQLASADAYYLGGHKYEVTGGVKIAIEAAGVGGSFEAQ